MTSGHKRLLSCGAGSIALVAALAVLYKPALPEFIPTLDGANLAGQISSDDIVVFSATEAEAGIDIPANRHVVFSCGASTDFGLLAGRLQDDQISRFWVYEYSGQEPETLGAFFVSPGELAVNPGYASIDTLRQFHDEKRYYLMTSIPLRFQCGTGLSKPEQCGNGILEGSEQCDVIHEGCNQQTCTSKPGFVCENNTCRIFIPTLGGRSSSAASSTGNSSSLISDATHTICSGNACTTVFGPGANQCTTSADCGRSSSTGIASSMGNSSSAGQTIALHSASINNDAIRIVYSKNFDTCAHVYGRQGLINHRINFICATGDSRTATASFADMGVSFTAGQEIKLCHGNNGNICSGFVVVRDAGQSQASLDVVVKNIGTSDTAVANQNDVNLLRFEARASEAKDILFTSATIEAQQGPLTNAQNYNLWADSDGNGLVDTILQSGVPAMNGRVVFGALLEGGFVLPKEDSVVFEVHADMASSFASNVLQVRLAIEDADYITAEALDDGEELIGIATDGVGQGAIRVSNTESIIYRLGGAGSLFVTQDSSPIRNRQLLGSTLGEAVMRLELRAEQEDIDVMSLHIAADGDPSSIDRLELYAVGATTPFATATRGACGAGSTEFCAEMAAGQLIVPQDQSTDVIVRPRMKSDDMGSIAGQEIRLALVAGNSVRARGVVSSQELEQNDGDATAEAEVIIGRSTPGVSIDILAPVHVVVNAKIASISNANPDANGTAVPTGIAPIGQFRFQAATHANTRNGLNDVVIGGIIFDVAAANVAISAGDFRIYNKGDSSIKHRCYTYYTDGTPFTAAQISGSFYVECNGMENSDINTQINSNENITLALEANILSSALNATASSSLQVSMGNFASMTNAYGLDTPSMSHFYWSDEDAGNQVDFAWVEHGDTVVTSTVYQN